MKRILVFVLALMVILAIVPALGATAKADTVASTATVTAKPFYGLTWDAVERGLFGNLEDAPTINVVVNNGVVSLGGTNATNMKSKLDALPEGMRYIRIFKTLNALTVAEDVIYADEGVAQLKALVTNYIEEYYALGGKLDGIILDTEYTAMHNWYIYRDVYYATESEGEVVNKNIYSDIVNNPKYLTDVRPLLEERGFVFHTPEPNHSKPERRSELFSIWPNQYLNSFPAYANCQAIWNRVMYNRIANYMTEAIYEPMVKYYPNATVSDYQSADTATWENSMSTEGGVTTVSGNSIKAGNTSNYNIYNSGPSSDFFKDGDTYLYKNIQGFNKAVFEDDPYHSLLFNVNRFKAAYNATDTKKISVWVAEYDYSGRANSFKNNAYYTEFMYHMGMLDPLPFLIYMYRGAAKFTGDEGLIVYNERMEVISQILDELTRVAGYSDRKPIATQQAWNNGFVLSGMYANGRNIWRLSPDTTEGMSLDRFKVAASDPTFSINGNTITFPGGNILTDATIQSVGSCGYWIETAADVQPVITREDGYYAKYPSYMENFENYEDGTVFNGETAIDPQAWVASTDLLIEDGALALTGTATLDNVKVPKNITAGDAYAKQQAWELSFTLSGALNSGNVTFFNNRVKLEGGKIYYNANGSYVALADVAADTKYTISVNNNFNSNTATYTLSAGGVVVAHADNVAFAAVALPVSTISMSSQNVTTKVLVDDYKLYPNGFENTLKFYDGNTGVMQSATEKLTNSKVAFRLAWMNATNVERKGQIHVARYDNNGALVSDEVLKIIDMKPGFEGAETGVLENTTGKLTVYLHTCDETNIKLQNQKNATCTEDGYTGDMVCTDCGTVYEQGTVIKATGHKNVIIPQQNATCTTDGLTKGEYCANCNEVFVPQTVIPAGHKLQTVAGYAATCTEPGLTDLVRCMRCSEVLSPQTEIPALGHTEKIVEETKDATCTEAGFVKTTVTCEVCNEILRETTEEIPALGHTEKTTVETKSATCTEAGFVKTTVICEICGKTLSETTEEIAALGHTEKTAVVTKGATCTEAGFVKTTVTCEICGETLSETTKEIAAKGHKFDSDFDATCNYCDEVRTVEDGLIVNADDVMQLVDSNETHINHRVVVYYLGNQTVADITDEAALKTIDPEAKTQWGMSQINNFRLKREGNYVLVMHYNDTDMNGKKFSVYKAVTIEHEALTLPQIEVNNNKVLVIEGDESIINYRAVVYYLGNRTVSNITNERLLKSIDPSAKTYWDLEDINKIQLWESGNYVILLHYNVGKSAKQTIAKDFSVAFNELTIDVVNGKLVTADPDNAFVHHRAVVYYVGDELVNPDNEAEVKAVAISEITYWGLDDINKAKLTRPGNYVVMLHYNLPNSPKMTITVAVAI